MGLKYEPVTAGYQAKVKKHLDNLRKTYVRMVNPKAGHSLPHEIEPASTGDLIETYAAMAQRSKFIYQGKKRDELVSFFAEARENLERKDYADLRADIMDASRSGDQAAKQRLCSMVVVTTQNFMAATSSWLPFFDQRRIAHNDQAYLKTSVPQEVGVETIGLDGQPQQVQPLNRTEPQRVPMRGIATRGYQYPIADLEHGYDVRSASLANVDLSRDLNYQFDALVQAFLLWGAPNTRLKATFNTSSGPEATWDYYTHSRVNANNFPTGNQITLSDNTTSSGIRQGVLNAIIEYCTSWGSGVFTDGDLAPVSLIVPSKDYATWLDQVVISNTASSSSGNANTKVEEIFSNGVILSYGGYNWSMVADNTLDPTSGICYVRTNKSVGTVFFKDDFNQTLIDNSVALQLENKETIYQRMVFGVGFTNDRTPNMLAIKYRNAA